jgi:hypothetical protein
MCLAVRLVLVEVCACMHVSTRGCACMHECVFLMMRVVPTICQLPATTRMRVGVALAPRHADVSSGTSVLLGVRACVHVSTRGCACMSECVFLMMRVAPAIWHLLATTHVHVGVALAPRHADLSSGMLVLLAVRACVHVSTRGCACMRECAFLTSRVARAIWHLAATMSMRVGVALSSRHAVVSNKHCLCFLECAYACVCARVAARACVSSCS